MKPKIFIVGSSNGSNNIGDDAMFNVLVNRVIAKYDIVTDGALKWKPYKNVKRIPVVHYLVPWKKLNLLIVKLRFWFIYKYFKFFLKYNLPLPDPILELYRKEISSCAMVVFSGAGVINDIFAVHGVYGWGIITLMAKSMGKKVLISGNGIGPLKISRNKYACSIWVPLVNFIVVRERISSKSILLDLGYDRRKVIESVDDAFYLDPSIDEDITAESELIKMNLINNFVIINLHNWENIIEQEYVGQFLNAISNLKDEHILLLPNRFESDVNDVITLEKVLFFAKRAGFKHIQVFKTQHSPGVIKSIIKRSKFVIASRYHLGVFAYSQDVPAVLISLDNDYYKYKMKGVLEPYSLEEDLYIGSKDFYKIKK